MADKAIRIAYDARMISHSGIGMHVQNVLSRIQNDRFFDLSIIGNRRLIESILPDFKGRIIEFNASIYSLSEQLNFPEFDSDTIIHVPHYNAPWKYIKQCVVVLHDLIHLQSKEFFLPHYRLYARLMLSRIARGALRVETVSETTRKEFLLRYPAADRKTTAILNGIDHSLFRPANQIEVKRFRQKYNLPGDFLLAVGIGKKHKNADFLVRSLAPLWRENHLKLPLVLAGSAGKIPEYVQKTVDENSCADRVISLPFLSKEELPLLYSSARFLIMPSLLEGFGFPVAEAMACGTIVLSSNASCLPEIGGPAAVYFDPRKETSLQKCLLETLANKSRQKKMSDISIKQAKRFSWNKNVDQMKELYRNLARSGHAF